MERSGPKWCLLFCHGYRIYGRSTFAPTVNNFLVLFPHSAGRKWNKTNTVCVCVCVYFQKRKCSENFVLETRTEQRRCSECRRNKLLRYSEARFRLHPAFGAIETCQSLYRTGDTILKVGQLNCFVNWSMNWDTQTSSHNKQWDKL